MMPLTHASFFTGIGGFDVGLERAGFRTVSHSEVKPYSCAVLATRWPDVPNLGDLNALCPDGDGDHDCVIPPATVWTGGFPCSDFSIMGNRKGLLGGRRSSLGLVFLDLVRRHRPPFVVLENVPGLLTSHEGRDLGQLLGVVGDIGYGWSYRLLDARNFGLPQARRRVLVVLAADARDAGAVLDDSTDRSVDAAASAGPRGTALEGGGGGAAGDARIVLGPTYAASSGSLQRADGTTFPLTPNNLQYVIDEQPIVIERHGHFTPQVKRDGTAYTLLPPGAGGNIGEQYVTERRGLRDDEWDDLPHVWGDGGRTGTGDGPGAAGVGRGTILAARDDRAATVGDVPAGPGPSDYADGMRAATGTPGRVDDRVGAGNREMGPKHLDLARWHVLGRTVPVPIVEWIGLGLRTVIARGETTR